jgi:hypothetical protein
MSAVNDVVITSVATQHQLRPSDMAFKVQVL